MSVQHARPSSRRRFLGGLTFAGTAGFLGLLPRGAAAEPPPETTRTQGASQPQPLSGPPVRGGRAPPGRGLHRGALCHPRGVRRALRRSGLRRGRHRQRLRPYADHACRRGRPDHDLGRGPRRLLRAVRNRAGPRHPGPEGEERRRPGTGITPSRFPRQHGRRMWVWIPARTSTGSCTPRQRLWSCSPTARSMP